MKSPVIVWTMGKVGSLSVYQAVKVARLEALHPHYCDAETLERMGKRIGHDMPVIKHGRDSAAVIAAATPKKPALIITMVRTPIERNISSYFHNQEYINVTTQDVGEMTRHFIKSYPHKVAVDWLDANLKKVIGLDVYEEPFNKRQGFRVYDRGRHKVLLLRSDLTQEAQSAAVSDFVGRPVAVGRDVNVGAEKSYAKDYRTFIDQIVLSKDHVERMLGSRYAQHFWPRARLEELRRFWLREPPPSLGRRVKYMAGDRWRDVSAWFGRAAGLNGSQR